MPKRTVVAAAVMLALVPNGMVRPALAGQDSDDGPRVLSLSLLQSSVEPSAEIGLGFAATTDYEGSDDYQASALPLVNASYGPVFLRGVSAGLVALEFEYTGATGKNARVQVGPILRYYGGRDEDDNDALNGLGDIDGGIEAGGFLQAAVGAWSFDGTVVQDGGDNYDGVLVNFGAQYSAKISNRLTLSAGPTASWASEDYMQSFFGISNDQAVRSGKVAFDPGAGFKDVGIQAQLSYALSEKWSVQGQAGYSRLLGDAADSPLVNDEGSANQVRAVLGLSYRF